MGTVRKIGNDYFIEFYARGLKYQKKAGPDRQAAEKLLAEVEAKIAQGEMGIIVRDVDIDIFFADFLEQALKEHAPRTVSRYRSLTGHFMEFLKGKYPQMEKLSEVTPKVIDEYKLYLSNSPKVRSKRSRPKLVTFTLMLLSDMLKYGIKLGYINDDPTLHVERSKEKNVRRPGTIDEDEYRDIRKQMTKDTARALDFMMNTGLTPKEARALTWENIDMEDKRIQINPAERPNGYPRNIPLSPETLLILEELKMRGEKGAYVFADKKGSPDIPDDFDAGFRRMFNGRSPAVVRHTFAKRLAQKGVALSVLYRILGLNDIVKTARYIPFYDSTYPAHFSKMQESPLIANAARNKLEERSDERL